MIFYTITLKALIQPCTTYTTYCRHFLDMEEIECLCAQLVFW